MYPVMMDLKDRRCLVVGGGGVAARKVLGLLESGAKVTVVAPEVAGALQDLGARSAIRIHVREYRSDDLVGCHLVFAATDSEAVNREIAEACEVSGILVNVADDPDSGSFHLPARVQRGPLQIAVASTGQAPFAVRRLRRLLERRFGPEWNEWMTAATRYRDQVRALTSDPQVREALFERFFSETVDGDRVKARVPTEREECQWFNQMASLSSEERPKADPRQESSSPEASGFVSLVGAGPGCPGLMTVRGRRRLVEADAVVYDRLAAPALPCDLKIDVELHPVGKTAGFHPIPQEEITAILVRLAREGKKVVRLKGGDPYVFGRGGEEAEVLKANGVDFEVLPGVTSGIAASAWAGIPVTHRREVVSMTLVTGHEAAKTDGPQVRWDLLAQDEHATIVGYMGLTSLPKVVRSLLEGGMDPEMPAAMIERGTTAEHRSVISTVKELPDAVLEAKIEPPALFVIGPTVHHAEALDWMCNRPLTGRRLVVMDCRSRVVHLLEDAGATVVALPVPVTAAARVVMGVQALSGCLVQSATEVDCMHEERDGDGWDEGVVSFCVGAESAGRARERGWLHVVEIEADVDDAGLVDCIAAAATERRGS